MKNYYIEFTNGEYEFIEAKNDKSAYTKSYKLAKDLETKVNHLYETFEDEEDRMIF